MIFNGFEASHFKAVVCGQCVIRLILEMESDARRWMFGTGFFSMRVLSLPSTFGIDLEDS